MKMEQSTINQLKLSIGSAGESTNPTLLVYIDGLEFRRIIQDNSNAAFFPELEQSAKESGEYLILTCECGVADCGGWDKMKVVHTSTNVSWNFTYGNNQFMFQFEKENYNNEIQKIKVRIHNEELILQPQFIVDPEE